MCSPRTSGMTTMPAPLGLAARAAYAMNFVPSADASLKSLPPAEPPAMGVMGGRESLSTHIGGLLGTWSRLADCILSGESPMTTTAALGVLLAVLLFLTAYPMAMLVYGSLHTTPPGEIGVFSLDGYRAMLSGSNA